MILLLPGLLTLGWLGRPLAQADPTGAVPPLFGDVTRGFDPPAQPWLAGHRGVDLAGAVGDAVVAALAGTITFAGQVAGTPVVAISHGSVSTTYEPVVASVSPGQVVATGQVIGTLQAGHPCPVEACLHWGLRQGDTYLDPLSLLAPGPIRLISAAAMDQVRQAAAALAAGAGRGGVSPAGLSWPANGPVTSPFGMRFHPIDHVWRFHDGLDIGAACGSAIMAAAPGRVVEVSYSSGWGNRVVIDHGVINGQALKTSYNHAASYQVAVGDTVARGQVIGAVGSTGVSTGCHLHFQVWLDGRATDPASVLPG